MCTRCQQSYPLDNFHRDSSKKDGHASSCKRCKILIVNEWQARNVERRRVRWRSPKALRQQRAARYGLNEAQLQALEARYGGVCPLCQQQASLVIDHCHQTQQVRGMLCQKCNKALGALGDTKEGLQRALSYLSGS